MMHRYKRKLKKMSIVLLTLIIFVLPYHTLIAEDGTYEVGIPSNVMISATSSEIMLTWEAVSEASGYDVEVDGSMQEPVVDTAFIHHGLGSFEEHTYRVRARKETAVGAWTNEIKKRTTEPEAAIITKWASNDEMLANVYGHGSVTLNGKIYIVGGYTHGYSKSVYAYDPILKEWSIKASMTTPRYSPGVVALNGKIYAIGGYNATQGVLNTVEEYDPSTDKWTKKTPMITARSRMGVTVADGRIYAIGGYSATFKALDVVEEYNLNTNQWSTKKSMPTPKSRLSTEAVNGKIYAIGGYNGAPMSQIEEYDCATDAWILKAHLPFARYGMSSVQFNGRILLFGGYNSYSLDRVEEYDPSTNTFTKQAPMYMEKYDTSAVVVNGRIYVLGGTSGTRSLGTIDEAILEKPRTPLHLVLIQEGQNIKLTWNRVAGATGYDVEIDGIPLDHGMNTEYIHENPSKNHQHDYRVRAKNTAGAGEWTQWVSDIVWAEGAGVCLTATSGIPEYKPGDEPELTLKANNFTDAYTFQLEFQYDPTAFMLDEDSVSHLLWEGDSDAYFAVKTEVSKGTLKVMLSRTGVAAGKNGGFDILKMKFLALKPSTSAINLTKLFAVDSKGEFINMEALTGLNVRVR